MTKAAAVAAAVVLSQYFPDRDDGSGAVLGGIVAFAAAAAGFAAVDRVRPLPRRTATERLAVLLLSLVLGVGLGLFNLLANYAIAALDPRIHAHMIEQWAGYSGWSIVFGGPIVEEIVFRLLLMGGAAWLLSRVTKDQRAVFLGALAISSLLFGLVHILPSSRPTIGLVHAVAVAVKSGAAGILLGWIFWRKGLPSSMTSHCTANAVHLVLWPALF